MIKAENITKSYGSLQVLRGIDVEISKGQIVSIVGASGAGKTTFLQIIGTLSKPDSGKVWINGIDVLGLRERELARFRNQHIGCLFQFHHLLPEFNAMENVCIPALINKQSKKKAEAKAIEILTFLGNK